MHRWFCIWGVCIVRFKHFIHSTLTQYISVSGSIWELSHQHPGVLKSQSCLDRYSGLHVQLDAPGSPGNKFGSTNAKSGSTWECQQQAWEFQLQVWECQQHVWERQQHAWEHLQSQQSSLGKTASSSGLLLVLPEIIDTTYRWTIFKTI